MRHGFESEAERRALAEREVLSLTASCRLDPRWLAESKGIPVVGIGALPGISEAHLRRLREEDPRAFSAAAVLCGADALIAVNDAHTKERQNDSIAHELAHLLLGHQPITAFDADGVRSLDTDVEDEADWLAGCLLVPAAGISMTMRRYANDLHRAATHYGVSVGLMRLRHKHARALFVAPHAGSPLAQRAV